MVKKAMILTWEKFQDHELIYPYYSLKEHGFEVTLVANKLGKIYGSLGTHMNCDLTTLMFEDAVWRKKYLEEYELLVIPGGVKALEKLRQEQGVCTFVKEWDTACKTIFSICNGAQLLISAKAVRGKRLSGYYAIQIDIENAGGFYDKGPVVIDGNIVSCPHYDFMGEWLAAGYKSHDERVKRWN